MSNLLGSHPGLHKMDATPPLKESKVLDVTPREVFLLIQSELLLCPKDVLLPAAIVADVNMMRSRIG